MIGERKREKKRDVKYGLGRGGTPAKGRNYLHPKTLPKGDL